VEVVVVFENSFTVKKTVVYLVYDEPSLKRFFTEEETTDDFNQNKNKKNRME
jgi:hypothetical protein